MKPLHVLSWLVVALSAVGLPACSGGSSGKPKVAFVSNNPDTFWTIAEAGCRKAEQETDVEVIFRKPSEGDPAKQKEIVDALLHQNIKAIAISVIDPKGQTGLSQRDGGQGAVDHPGQRRARTPNGFATSAPTTTWPAARSASWSRKPCPKAGMIAIFVGQLEPLNARQRRQGVLDELAGREPLADINDVTNSPDGETYGKYKLHKTLTDQPIGEQKARQNASIVLTDLADEKNLCLIGLWAYNPPAILTAVKDKGTPGPGQDRRLRRGQRHPQGHRRRAHLRHGGAEPFKFGYESVKMMAALAKGDQSAIPANGSRFVPHRVITKDGGKDRIPVEKFRKTSMPSWASDQFVSDSPPLLEARAHPQALSRRAGAGRRLAAHRGWPKCWPSSARTGPANRR